MSRNSSPWRIVAPGAGNYSHGMNALPALPVGHLGLFRQPDGRREVMMQLTAVLALRGPVRLVDGGNCFAVYPVARYLRAHTAEIEPLLQRITIARAFTSYQMVRLLTQTPSGDTPLLVLNLLTLFEDESVDDAEAVRLVRLAIAQLRRLRRHGVVWVSQPPPVRPERACLWTMLTAAADCIWQPPAAPEGEHGQQGRLL
jgi:hypothetical protein